MMHKGFPVLILALLLLPGTVLAQKKKEPFPPALVITVPARMEKVSPTAPYSGTVHFKDVSEVAAEVTGKVDRVLFQEGLKVKKGEPLVILDSQILRKELASAKGALEEAQVELEKARIDLQRIEALYKRQGASRQLYDNYLYKVKALEKKVAALEASHGKLTVMLKKKTIRAPFDGVVIKRKVDVGEWMTEGSVCAVVGRLSPAEVVVSVPSKYLKYLKPGASIPLTIPSVSKETIRGQLFSIIPLGDMASRTFPVKIRLANRQGLYLDGMEARVQIPVGPKGKALVVSRDAIVSFQGGTFVFTVAQGRAQILPVKVKGYFGDLALVEGRNLKPGIPVVIRGNERLRPGQPVRVANKR